MNTAQRSVVLTAVLAVASAGMAFADDDPAVVAAGAPPVAPMVQQSPAGVAFVNGGAGAEQRVAMQSLQSSFPLRLVFSTRAGQYVVVDHVTVQQGGARLLDVDAAGPMLLVGLQPGSYRVETQLQGKTESREVKVGSQPRTVNWQFAEG